MNIADQIRENLDHLTSSEKKAGTTLLGHYPFLGLETMQTFADKASVSPPTILRFVSKLGYPGYREFQQQLRAEVHERLESPLTLLEKKKVSWDGKDSVSAVAKVLIENVETTLSGLSEDEMVSALERISDSRRKVYIVGGRFSYALADYFYCHLREIRDRVILLDGQTARWPEHLIDMKRGDILIVYDMRRYQDDISKFVEAADEVGACIMLFTDQWISPVASHARNVWSCHIEIPSPFDSFVSCVAVMDVLVARMAAMNETALAKRIRRLEWLRNKAGIAK